MVPLPIYRLFCRECLNEISQDISIMSHDIPDQMRDLNVEISQDASIMSDNTSEQMHDLNVEMILFYSI